MYVTDRHDMTLAVKVALNPNTTNLYFRLVCKVFIFVFVIIICIWADGLRLQQNYCIVLYCKHLNIDIKHTCVEGPPVKQTQVFLGLNSYLCNC